MSDIDKEIKAKDVSKEEWNADNVWIITFILLFCFGGCWSNTENPRISELEKKVARLEGQMSMIGGKIV